MVGGFVASLGMFVGGLAFATYLLAVEPAGQPGPSVDVADLWTAEPRRIDSDAQHLERVPAQPPTRAQATAPLTPLVDTIATASVEAAADAGGGRVQTSRNEGQTEPARDEPSAAHAQWCTDRYRSYRPEDNSYTSYRGEQQPCVSPFTRDLAATEPKPSPVADDFVAFIEEESPVQYAVDAGAFAGSDHVSDCYSRYRSYRPEDNSYQPFGGGPRRQCR